MPTEHNIFFNKASFRISFPRYLLLISVLSQAANVQGNVSVDRLPELSLQELMDIEITSVFRRPEKLSQSPSAIQVITNDQIRRSGATNIPEALRLATNLNVAQLNSQEWVITARGFSSDVGNKLLVMIDGRTVYTPLFSGVFWDRQNYLLEDIERIEVISGPGGTLWGANAVNGVINIITKSSKDTNGLYANAGVGTALEGFAGLRYGEELGDKSNYRIYGKFFQRDSEYKNNGDDGEDEWHMGQAGFRIDSQENDSDTFTLQGDYYQSQANVPATVGKAETTGYNILGRWSHTLDDDASTQLQIYYDYTDLYLPVAETYVNGNVFLAPAGVFKDELQTFDVDFQHQFEWGSRQTIVWGWAYRRTENRVENAPGLGFTPDHLEQDLYSGFIQDEIELLPNKLTFTIGTKVERNDYTGNEWEPNIRLHWNVSSRQMVWSAASRAVRIPSRIDRDLSSPYPPYLTILAGGSEFDSEKVDAYEIGYRIQTSEKIIVSLATFFNQYDDIRSTNITLPTVVPFFFENNLEGNTYGVEFNMSYQATSWWQLRGGYNFLEQSLEVKEGEFDLNNALNETADPKHQASIRSSMEINSTMELDIGLRWIDDVPIDDNGEIVNVPSYAELDIRFGWHPSSNIELSLVGQNLLHDEHQEFGLISDNAGEIGRNVYAEFEWRY